VPNDPILTRNAAKGILVGYSAGSVTDALTSDKAFATASHTSIHFQGFMEGGAAEGKRAARTLRRIIPGD
jgi:hypothetical protein